MTERPHQRLARPYALTGGRTRPADDTIAVEALVEMSWRGYAARDQLTFESREILDLTQDTMSVAEVAAHLEVPLGVARVLVSDLAEEGLVVIHPPPDTDDEGHANPELLERVLDGLRSL